MIVVETDVVDTGRHELYYGRHGAAIMADGAETDLSVYVILSDVLESNLIIGFCNQFALTIGNGVHGRNEP